MTLVRANVHGYFGGVVRSPGDTFDVPDELWSDKDRRPSWAEAVNADGGDADPVAQAVQVKGKGRGKKAETVDVPSAEPFADAPEPVAVAKGNGVKEALGAEPDWIAPKPID